MNISATTCNSYVTYAMEIVNTTPYKAYITSNISSILNMDDGQLYWTSEESFSVANPYPDITTTLFPANSDSIRTYKGFSTDTTTTYCIIIKKVTTIYSTVMVDMYEISNVRYEKVDS